MKIERLSGKQRASVLGSDARINIWHGSVRASKTVCTYVRWLQYLRNGPRGDLLMAGKTERTLARNILNPLQEILGPSRMHISQGTGEARILGRRCYLASANDERAEAKIRGGTFAGAYGDELTLWPESFWQMLLSRLSVRGAKLFGTTNADGPRHWLKVNMIDREKDLDLKAFHFNIDDNPFLDADYVASLKKEYTGLWHRRFIKGEWCLAEGVIWDAFDLDGHCFKWGQPEMVKYIVGIDYGTSNPLVALLIGVDAEGRFWAVDEWRWDSKARSRQMTDAQYSAALGEWIKAHGVTPTVFWVDPSAASFILQLRQDHPWTVLDAENDVYDGLRVTGTAIAGDRIRFATACQETIDEILAYSWDVKAGERGEDKPVKQNDHGPDALRYAVYSQSIHDDSDLSGYGWVA